MSFGPTPWHQTQWDWRAAGNFICGGAGSGLIVCAALSGASGRALSTMLLVGMACVGAGLSLVWLEIGRPLRALNVFIHPRRSWMSREAIVATLLMPVTLASALWQPPGGTTLAAVLALAFVYCQARMLNAARGIPAWREPLLQPLIVLTGLVEGAGLMLLLTPLQAAARPALLAVLCALVVLRTVAWMVYRHRVLPVAARPVQAVFALASLWMRVAGSLLPLALIGCAGLLVRAGELDTTSAAVMLVMAALAMLLTGVALKFTLITRAGFNQGFTLTHLPVRGARR